MFSKEEKRIIYCCDCGEYVEPRLTDGEEVYPYRTDLYSLPFWKCDVCENFVGCHHKTKDRTKPLGCIPNYEIKEWRKKIHKMLDPLWKSDKLSRKKVYSILNKDLRYEYHTANISSVEEATKVITILEGIYGSSVG